ncbi:hypothetical protein [Geotalea toluenoxydans]|uniref:hypothetical protein n=1 Tax=Geotalea toluenoxydans TaxID=421624 RepID=UPI001FB47978|nr:hypothetical protein [Geotalea toluenoxydans]
MIHITDPLIASYLMTLQPEEDPRLLAMEEKAAAMNFPIIDRQVEDSSTFSPSSSGQSWWWSLARASATRPCGLPVPWKMGHG